jgi:hypothetical protein
VYDDHDEDRNGMLSLREAELALKSLGGFAKNVDNFTAEYAKFAKSGGLSFDDFKKFCQCKE